MLNPDTFQKVDRISPAFRADLEQLKVEQFVTGEVPLYAVNGGGNGVAGYWVLTTHRVFHVTLQPKDRAFKSIGEGRTHTYLPPDDVTRPLKVQSRNVYEVHLSDLSSATRHDLVLKQGLMGPTIKMIEIVGMGRGGGFGNGFRGVLEYDDGLVMYKVLHDVLNADREKPTDTQTVAEIRQLVKLRARGEMPDVEFASKVEALVQ